MKQTLPKLQDFLKSPQHKASYKNIKGWEFLHLLMIIFAILIPYIFILDLAGIDEFDHKMEVLLKEQKWLLLVLGIVIAPLLEEPIYRLHLDFKKPSIWWGLGLSVLVISEVWITVVLLWIWLLFLLFKVSKGDKPKLKYGVFISSALFAIVHLGNFTDFDYAQYFYWIPFMVGAQFLIGLVLSYIRLNYGMKWAIIFHGVYNAILILPAIYFYEG